MYNLEKLSVDIKDIPEAFIYKWYSEYNDKRSQIITQPFDGRTIRMHSFMNKDTTPSLFLYYRNDGSYHWKDHSSGISGDAIYFVQQLISKNWHIAVEAIKREYDVFLENGGDIEEYNIRPTEVINIEFEEKKRTMTTRDLDFWLQWKIKSHLIIHYKVDPLISYSLLKDNQIIGNFNHLSDCYGFYSKNEGLYQIYQPGQKEYKYVNTKKDYLIGSDQLLYNRNTCIITSGLKDLMSLKVLGLALESVAPKSENTIISYDKIEMLKSKYKHVITMFDNDDAGVKAMNLYKKVYDIPFIHLHLHKDLAENNEKEELDFLRKHYSIYINKLIN